MKFNKGLVGLTLLFLLFSLNFVSASDCTGTYNEYCSGFSIIECTDYWTDQDGLHQCFWNESGDGFCENGAVCTLDESSSSFLYSSTSRYQSSSSSTSSQESSSTSSFISSSSMYESTTSSSSYVSSSSSSSYASSTSTLISCVGEFYEGYDACDAGLNQTECDNQYYYDYEYGYMQCAGVWDDGGCNTAYAFECGYAEPSCPSNYVSDYCDNINDSETCGNSYTDDSGVFYTCVWIIGEGSYCEEGYAPCTAEPLTCNSLQTDDCSTVSFEDCNNYYQASIFFNDTLNVNCKQFSDDGDYCSYGDSYCDMDPLSSIGGIIDVVTGILPKFGDLLSGVGTSIVWPVVEILIILGIAGVVLGLFAMVTGIVYAVVHAVTSFASGMGKSKR